MKHLQNYINNSTVNSRIELEAKIAELERQLVEHREELADTEQRHQRQLTVVGALATAIKQTLSAVRDAVEAGEPGLVDSFWQEMQDIQDGNYDDKELLSLPSKDGDDSNNSPDSVNPGPYTHESLVPLNLSKIKEIARGLGISVKGVKKYGSTRQKLSWITAIIEEQKGVESQVESNGKVETNEEVEDVNPIVTDPPVENDDVVDVDSTVVEDYTVEDENSKIKDESPTIEDENDYEGW